MPFERTFMLSHWWFPLACPWPTGNLKLDGVYYHNGILNSNIISPSICNTTIAQPDPTREYVQSGVMWYTVFIVCNEFLGNIKKYGFLSHWLAFKLIKLFSTCTWHTVYPKKYAHGFCFAVLCCGYTLTDFPISIRLTSLALWQSNDCPSASKATLMNMDKYFMWIHYERLHNHNKAKHNKTVCIFLVIYCRRRLTLSN